jgi:hypothetical protein
MSKRELLIALGLAAAFVFAIVGLRVTAVDRQRGDTAIFFQLAENVAQRGAPVSQVFANTQAFLEGGTLSAPVKKIASEPLAPPAADERNMLGFHAYSVLFLTGALAKIFPSNIVVFGQMVVSFIGLGLLCYVLLRREKVSVVAALAFCLLVVSHPAWSESLLSGQPYPDRLFLLVGFAFMYLVTRPTAPTAWLVGGALLCASVNERGAIVAGEFLFLHTLLFWKERTNDRVFRAGLGAGFFTLGTLVATFVLHNAQYASFLPGSPGQLWSNLSSSSSRPLLELFALVNFPFLVLAFFEWKTAAIAVVLMIPNVIGTIGGAEKTGWATPYHTYYLPALILAACIGYRRLYEVLKIRKCRWVIAPALGSLVAYFCLLSPVDATPVRFGGAYARYHFISALLDDKTRYFSDYGRAMTALANDMRAAVPDRATVSSVEAGMPIMYRRDEIRFFPIGIDRADYALMSYAQTRPGTRYYGAITFLGPASQEQLDAAILRRMRADGYDFAHARKYPLLGLALVKRLPVARVRAASSVSRNSSAM